MGLGVPKGVSGRNVAGGGNVADGRDVAGGRNVADGGDVAGGRDVAGGNTGGNRNLHE